MGSSSSSSAASTAALGSSTMSGGFTNVLSIVDGKTVTTTVYTPPINGMYGYGILSYLPDLMSNSLFYVGFMLGL